MTVAESTATRAAEARRALRAAESKTGVVAAGRRIDERGLALRRPLRSVAGGGMAADGGSVADGGMAAGVGILTAGSGGGPGRRRDEVGAGPGPRRVEGLDLRRDGGFGRLTAADLGAWIAARAPRGPALSVQGSTGALFAAAAALWGPEDWGAFAALPDAGLLAARQAGVPLERAVVIPDLGPQPLRLLAGLVDAFGVVVLGALALGAADRRRLEARARHRHGVIVAGGPWPGAAVEARVERVARGGIGRGGGTLAPARLDVRLDARVHALWGADGAWAEAG
jgi:hypothetical protein